MEVCMKKIAIIGGGAAGIMAAIQIKQALNDQVEVAIYEKMDRIGKKLLATGNGKCNLTNACLDTSLYNNELGKNVTEKITPSDVMCAFHQLGLLTHQDNSGRVYPITDSANTVLDIFLKQLKKHQVKVYTNTVVQKISKLSNGYLIKTSQEEKKVDIIIVATGGGSSSFLGSNQEGYALLKPLGIHITTISPGLVGLKTQKEDVSGLNGLRQKVELSIYENNEKTFSEKGEVQFKEDGVSGIVVMNASSYILRKKGTYCIYLDLLPELDEKTLASFLKEYEIIGILPKMLAEKINKKAVSLEEKIALIKHYPLHITNSYGFDRSQVTLGGVDIFEVDDHLECKKLKHLFIVGELLDVDGPCGGYNLHFAFASAILVSNYIIQMIRG